VAAASCRWKILRLEASATVECMWQRHPAAGIHCGWKPQPLAAARGQHVRYLFGEGQAEIRNNSRQVFSSQWAARKRMDYWRSRSTNSGPRSRNTSALLTSRTQTRKWSSAQKRQHRTSLPKAMSDLPPGLRITHEELVVSTSKGQEGEISATGYIS
jgi:hypothetical protein